MAASEAPSSTWLITGASSGFGKSIAAEALRAGHRVIGTTRDVARAEASCPDFMAQGGIWMDLDPAREDSFDQVAQCAREHRINILVNNAGYAFIGGIEDTSEEEIREQMEVNFYAPLRTVRACLPVMRENGAGHIVLISSGAGFISRPGRGLYSASKFAAEAAHEALRAEVEGFGINTLIVEPGAFRTPFTRGCRNPARLCQDGGSGFSDAYKGTPVEQMVTMHRKMSPIEELAKGDTDKAARVIVEAVVGGHSYLRLPLGTDCVKALEDRIAQLQRDLDATRELATSTDAD